MATVDWESELTAEVGPPLQGGQSTAIDWEAELAAELGPPPVLRAEPQPQQQPTPQQPAPEQPVAKVEQASLGSSAMSPREEPQKPPQVFDFEGTTYSAPSDWSPETISRWLNKYAIPDTRRNLTRERAGGRSQYFDSEREQKLRTSTPVGQQGLKEWAEYLSGEDAEGKPIVVKPEDVTPQAMAEVVKAYKQQAEESAKATDINPVKMRELNEDIASLERDLERRWPNETTAESVKRQIVDKMTDKEVLEGAKKRGAKERITADAARQMIVEERVKGRTPQQVAADEAILNSRPGYVARKNQPKEAFWAENLLREYQQKYGDEIPRDKKPAFDNANKAYDAWLKSSPNGAEEGFDDWRRSAKSRSILHPEEQKQLEEQKRDPQNRQRYNNLSEAMVAYHAYNTGDLDVVPYLLKRIPFAGTAVEAADLLSLRNAVKNIEAKKATDSDWFTLAGAIDAAEKSKDRGFGRKVFDLVSQLPAMGVEFTMTGGGFTAARAGARKLAAQVLGKQLLRRAVPRMAVKAAGFAAGVAGRTALNAPLVAAKVSEKWMPEYDLTRDETGQLTAAITGDDPSFLEALGKGFGAAYIEMGSEEAGRLIGIGGKALAQSAVGQALAKIPLAQRTMALKAAVLNRFLAKGGTAAKAREILDKAGWNGMIGEVFEERVADVAGGVTGIEKDYGTTGKLLANDPEGWEQLGVEALSFSAIPIGQTVLSAADAAMAPKDTRGPVATREPVSTPRAQTELEKLRQIVAKGWVTVEEANDAGLSGQNRGSRKAAVQARIQQLEQEISDAEKVPSDQVVPEEAGQVGERVPADSLGDIRGPGQEQVGAQPAGEVAETQVEPETPDIAELKRMDPKEIEQMWLATFPGGEFMPTDVDEQIQQIAKAWGGEKQKTTPSAADLNTFADELEQEKQDAELVADQPGAVAPDVGPPAGPVADGTDSALPIAPAPSVSEPADVAAQPEGREGVGQAGKHEFSSTQVNLPKAIADEIVSASQLIDEADLAEDGRETEPHITVKYGLHTEDVEAVRKLVQNEPPITVKLGKISTFENDDYDVVKVDVESDDLRRINKKIADNLEVTDTQPSYKPHVTLAYVKKGEGKKYASAKELGHEITLDALTFSSKTGERVDIPLLGTTPSIAEPPQAPQTPIPAETPQDTTPPAETQQEATQAVSVDYSGMTGKELTAEAKKRGLKGFGGKKVAAIRTMLEEDDRAAVKKQTTSEPAEVTGEVATETKQPWQVSSEAYSSATMPERRISDELGRTLQELDVKKRSWRKPEESNQIYPTLSDLGIDKKAFRSLVKEGYAEDRGFGPSTTPKAWFELQVLAGENPIVGVSIKSHEQIVEEALAAGKEVPAEVLAEYPDLKPVAETTSTPAELPSEPVGPSVGVPEGLDPIFYRRGLEARSAGIRNPEASGVRPGTIPWKSWMAGNEAGEKPPKRKSRVKSEEPPSEPEVVTEKTGFDAAIPEATEALKSADMSTRDGELAAMREVKAIAEKHGVGANELWRDVAWDAVGGMDIETETGTERKGERTKPSTPSGPGPGKMEAESDIREAYESGNIDVSEARRMLAELRAKPSEPETKPAKGFRKSKTPKAARGAASSLSQASKAADKEVSEALDKFGKTLRSKGAGSNLFLDAEILAAAANLTVKLVKAGVLRFAVAMERMTARFGEAAEQYRPAMERAWDDTRAANPDWGMEAREPETAEPEEPTSPPAPPAAVPSQPPQPAAKKPPPSGFIGIKRARLEMQADAAGLPRPTEVESVNAIELVANAVANLTPKSDQDIQALAAEVITSQKSITVEQTAELLASVDYHSRKADEADDLYNKHMAAGELEKARIAEEESALHKTTVRNLSQAARDVGRRQFAYMGHVLQILVDKDGQAHIERLLRKANDGRLDESDIAWAEKMAKQLEKAKKDQAKRGRELDEEEALTQAKQKIAELEAEIKRERMRPRTRGSKNKIVTQEAKDAAVQRILARLKNVGTTSSSTPAGIIVEMLADAAIVAGYHVEAGARKLADFSKAMIADLGAWVEPHLDDLYRKARAEYASIRLAELGEKLAETDDLRGQHSYVEKMAKEILAETRREDGTFIHREELLDRLHEKMKAFDPDITRRETMDMFSGYGKHRELSQEDLEVAYRDRRGESRELGKIDDMRQKIAPSSTGTERHTPSDEERQLHRDVRELKRQGEAEGWYYSGDKERKLKGTLESQKTRLHNEIRDLDNQIASGKKTVKDKTAPLTDAELEYLREQRDQKRERLDAVIRASEEADFARWESEGGTFVDPAVEEYLKVLDRQIRSLQKQLATKSVFSKPSPWRPGGQAVDVKRAQIEALQAEKALMRKILDPNYETNQKLLNAEKAAERELAKLEKEQAEGFKMREKPQPIVSDKLKETRAKLSAIRQQRRDSLEGEYALRAAIAQSTRNSAKISERLASGDFSPRKRKPKRTWDDPEFKKAKANELEARKQLAEKIAEYEWEHMTGWGRTKFYAGRVRDVWKAVMTGFDQTALGLQGGIVTFTNPAVWSKALVPTAKALMSEENRELLDAERESHPNYERFKNYGLAVREHGVSKDMAATEFYGSDALIDRIFGVAMSERSFSTFINELRFNLMQVLEWSYTKDGRQLTPTQGEALARIVNAFTLAYKPKSHKLQIALGVAGEFFWAPSMYVARLQLAVGAPVLFNPGADSRVRMIAAKQYLKAAVGIAVTTAVLRMLLDGDDDDELNMTDPDYYKVKHGNIRMDLTSGLGQMMVLGARILNSIVDARLGEPLWETKGRPTSTRELFGSFASFKTAPWVSAIFDFTEEKDVVGRPTSLGNILLSNITPLSVQTLVESVEEAGMIEGLAWTLPGVTGRNLSIYDQTAPKSEETFLATTLRLGRRMIGAEAPGLKPAEMDKWLESKIEWDADLSAVDRFLTPEQVKQAKSRLENRKQAVVFNGLNPEPKRTPKDTDETYQKKLDAHSNAQNRLREMTQTLGLSHAEAQRLLVESYRKPNAEGVMQTEVNARNTRAFDKSYPEKGIALAKLYGLSEEDFWKFRDSAEFQAWDTRWQAEQGW